MKQSDYKGFFNKRNADMAKLRLKGRSNKDVSNIYNISSARASHITRGVISIALSRIGAPDNSCELSMPEITERFGSELISFFEKRFNI